MNPEASLLSNYESRTTLIAFSRALNREAHVLSQHPNLLWQQLCNHLQWEGEQVNRAQALELAKRSAPGARSWFLLQTPLNPFQYYLLALPYEVNHP